MIRPLSGLSLFRFWLWERREPLGLAFAALGALILIGLVIAFRTAAGPGEPASGLIVGMGYTEGDDDPGNPIAEVRVQGRLVSVHLPRGSACKVGDTIRLRLTPTVWGQAYAAGLQPCADRPSTRP